MSVSSRGWRTVLALPKAYPQTCSRCAKGRVSLPWQQRAYSAAAAEAASLAPRDPLASEPPLPPPNMPVVAHPKAMYKIKSGLILTRAPILTREPTPFEVAFFLYQKRLNERLVSPFVKELYFKPDTPPALDWDLKLKERKGTLAKDIGQYKPKGVAAWNDEAPLGSTLADTDLLRERLVSDAELRFSDDGELLAEQDRVKVERPMPRRTEADEKGDVRRLDRALDRTLYLVVKYRSGEWGFPTGDVTTDENLHETAARVLEQAAGVNMITWLVGRVPVAHHIVKPVLSTEADVEGKGESEGKGEGSAASSPRVHQRGVKTFFLKGRIAAGQADLEGNTLGVTDFNWLTQEELKGVFKPDYFRSVRNMFAER